MHTEKGLWTLLTGLSLLFVSLVLKDWQVLALALPFLLLYLLAAALFLGRRPGLVLTKRLSETEVNEGAEIDVEVTARARGAGMGHVELYERLPGRVEVSQPSPYFACTLRRRGAVTHRFRLRAPLRGAYRIGPTVARIRGFLGLFYREMEADDPPVLLVTPKPFEVRALRLVGGKPKMRIGPVQLRHRGEGTDYYGIRRYQPADDPRRINWRASARTGSLLVNQYEIEDVADVTLVLDARRASLAGTIGDNPVDHGARAAASLAALLLKGRNRVGLLTYGDPSKEDWVYPDASRKQFYKILHHLVEIEAVGEETLASVVTRAMTHLLPARSFVILVTALMGDPTLEDGVRSLLARGYKVLIVSPSPVAIEERKAKEPHEKAALSLLAVERAEVVGRLRAAGANVIDWDPGEHLALAFEGVRLSPSR